MLVKETLKTEIGAMLLAMTKETDQAAAMDKFADKLTTAIDNYIKSATVTVAAAIPVSVDPVTHIGGTTAPGTGTIS
ncbi:MAG TPA: hypothetical protein VFC92_06540 [Bacteroidales bacterium]|jgi:hypothetical protein|nr:hypothetical protein [Bacteroidales bacterium]